MNPDLREDIANAALQQGHHIASELEEFLK
ncbi:hypothetical protein ACUW9G_000674 [Staphylococcus schleiferi]